MICPRYADHRFPLEHLYIGCKKTRVAAGWEPYIELHDLLK